MLTPALAARFADIALRHVTREYPNKLDHVLHGPGDLATPRALHPMFYGSFDWHSCVHGYWLLARLLRRHPALPEATRIRNLFATVFTPANVAAECTYLARPLSATFERPYGWAWLLMLAAELARHQDDDARGWSLALQPLAQAFAGRFLAFLPNATYPIRTGVHNSTAFGLALAMEYAQTCNDAALADSVVSSAQRWYLGDADCQAWEPGGDDFLSPALIEAECMRRVLPRDAFADWLDRFLPRIAQGEPKTLFQPATVSNRSDGKIAHLDGLNLSRAWCWHNLAASLPPSDARAPIMRDAADRHLEAGLPHVAGDYMGEHWLATFAVLALEATEADSDSR
ncbi:MAG: DUF2891 domain-containing protein [Acetobacteraceae bacterium]|nr:DUF2891 domain-containing protein [Acetobacteraceae bacterium]